MFVIPLQHVGRTSESAQRIGNHGGSACVCPWRYLTAPVFLHVDRVPRDRPVLFIGNHTLMGVLDTPLLMLGIYDHTGYYPRSMADDFHYAIPVWGDMLSHFGAVP